MPPRMKLLTLIFALFATACLVQPVAAQTDAGAPGAAPDASAASDGVAWLPDLVYGKGGDADLLLNLAQPEADGAVHPGIVIIHGGAWRAGNRRMHDELARELAKRGYVAATVSYRFCPQYTFPAQVEDVKCAVRFLRAHADEYHLDPQRIGAIGFSAGAHLSMMLGTLDADAGLEGEGGWADQSSKVQAVVSFFGPTDFVSAFPEESSRLVSDFLGGTQQEQPAAYQLASPISHVNRGDAPMMLFQGTLDNLVRWTQATRMAEALTQAGVSGRVELLIGKGHGWMGPELIRTLEGAVGFFDEHLKVAPKPSP